MQVSEWIPAALPDAALASAGFIWPAAAEGAAPSFAETLRTVSLDGQPAEQPFAGGGLAEPAEVLELPSDWIASWLALVLSPPPVWFPALPGAGSEAAGDSGRAAPPEPPAAGVDLSAGAPAETGGERLFSALAAEAPVAARLLSEETVSAEAVPAAEDNAAPGAVWRVAESVERESLIVDGGWRERTPAEEPRPSDSAPPPDGHSFALVAEDEAPRGAPAGPPPTVTPADAQPAPRSDATEPVPKAADKGLRLTPQPLPRIPVRIEVQPALPHPVFTLAAEWRPNPEAPPAVGVSPPPAADASSSEPREPRPAARISEPVEAREGKALQPAAAALPDPRMAPAKESAGTERNSGYARPSPAVVPADASEAKAEPEKAPPVRSAPRAAEFPEKADPPGPVRSAKEMPAAFAPTTYPTVARLAERARELTGAEQERAPRPAPGPNPAASRPPPAGEFSPGAVTVPRPELTTQSGQPAPSPPKAREIPPKPSEPLDRAPSREGTRPSSAAAVESSAKMPSLETRAPASVIEQPKVPESGDDAPSIESRRQADSTEVEKPARPPEAKPVARISALAGMGRGWAPAPKALSGEPRLAATPEPAAPKTRDSEPSFRTAGLRIAAGAAPETARGRIELTDIPKPLPNWARAVEASLVERQIQAAAFRPGAHSSRVDLLLHPEHLGRVAVRLIERGGVVEVAVRSDSAPVKNLLSESLPLLLGNMQQRGWEVSSAAGGAESSLWGSEPQSSGQRRESQERPRRNWREQGRVHAPVFSLEPATEELKNRRQQ